MNRFIKIICIPVDYFCIGLVWLYKLCISPLKPKTCRFEPTCSTYMILCIKKFCFYRGIFYGSLRLLRCKPNGNCGYDPIPTTLKGEEKWLF